MMKIFHKNKNKITVLWIIFFSLIPVNSFSQSQDKNIPFEDRPWGTIERVEYSGLNAFSLEDVAAVAGLRAGDVLTRQKLEDSITDLRKWGVFSKVEVVLQQEEDQIELFYELEEGFIIKNINIRGNYPLLDKKVNRVLFLSRGSLYKHERMAEQMGRLAKLYEREGYFSTTVDVVEDYDDKNREVSLSFKIKKGAKYRVRHQDIQGNQSLDEDRIKNIIYTFSHYKPRKIKKHVKKIKKIYQKRGRVRARVKLEGEAYDYDAKKVDISLKIREGPKVLIKFEGNESFKRTLKKQLTLFEGGDFDEYELEASAKKIKRFYLQRGFEEVEVRWERQKINADLYEVLFKIKEGPQIKVRKIEFNGNQNIKAKRLRKQMATKENSIGEKAYFLQPLFEEDLRNLETYYQEEGFPQAKIDSWEKVYNEWGHRVTLKINIQEGKQSKIEKIYIEGLKGLSPKQEKKLRRNLLLRPGKAFSTHRLSLDIQSILVALASHGYPYAEVSHQAKEIRPHVYNLTLDVDAGPLVRVGKLLFVGNTLSQEKILRKNLRIEEGDPFSAEKILQSQINLRSLGAFDSVNIETLGLKSRKTVVPIVVRLQEKKSKIINFEAGYNTDTGFSGQLSFNKLNMWGSGKHGNIKAQVGQELNRLELNYVDPRLFGKNLQLVLGVYGGREDRPFFENTEIGFFSSLFRAFGPRFSAFGRFDFNRADFRVSRTIFNQLNPDPDSEDRTRVTTTLGVTYDQRDNFGDPRRGYYAAATASLTNELIQRSGDYLTLRGNFGAWFSPFKKLTIANALRVARIETLSKETIVPADDRLYLGGDNTVRGFRQDALLPSGGTFSAVHNLEIQFRIFSSFQLVGFLDTGVVVNDLGDINGTTIRHSIGPGIRYVTPVGPIRLDYGIVLDPLANESQDRRLHFSFGYFF